MDHRRVTSNFLILWNVLLGVGCTPQCERQHFEAAKPLNHAMIEFKIEELEPGQGEPLQEGDTLEIYYREWIYDETRQDKKGSIVGDNYSSHQPMKIIYGKDELIDGWQEGLVGIKKGSKRRLFIPSTMAYSDQGAGPSVPKGAHLIYEIEVMTLVPAKTSE